MKKEISRRDFVKTSGALVVCFGAATLIEPFATAQGPFDTHPSHIDPDKLDSWIAVASDGTVTAYTGKCDFGQGMYSGDRTRGPSRDGSTEAGRAGGSTDY